MMERGDDDFGNELQVPQVEETKPQDWHDTFLANHDRQSFAQRR